MHQVKYQNEWESDAYFVNKKRVALLKKVFINDKEYKVKVKRIGINYNDMGHTYTAWSNHYFVTEDFFGVKMEFDLNTIITKKKVFVADGDYTLEKE